MTIIAVGHRFLVSPTPVEEKIGSIVVVQDKKMAANATTTGTVISIGPEAWCSFNRAAGFPPDRPWAKLGDVVSYSKYAGKWIVDPDDPEGDYLMLNDEDMVGIIRKSDAIPIDA